MKKLFWIGFFLFGVALAATVPFQLFMDGNRMKIHPVILNNRIYLPLEETARLFHQKATVDLSANRIVLEPMTQEEIDLSPDANEPPLQPVILGEIVSTVEKNATKPLGRIHVKLFKPLLGSDDDEENRAIELWIKNGDSRFLDAHGLVSETITNADGQFGFSKVPPGAYELVAVTSISPVEMAFWKVPFKLTAGQTQKIHLDLAEAYRVPLK